MSRLGIHLGDGVMALMLQVKNRLLRKGQIGSAFGGHHCIGASARGGRFIFLELLDERSLEMLHVRAD